MLNVVVYYKSQKAFFGRQNLADYDKAAEEAEMWSMNVSVAGVEVTDAGTDEVVATWIDGAMVEPLSKVAP